MKFALFITGLTGSGKTTLLRQLGLKGWHTFSSGDLFRSRCKHLKDGQNPITPTEFDPILQGELRAFMGWAASKPSIPTLVAIESIPRVSHQFNWVDEYRKMGWTVMVLILDAELEVRKARVMSRDIASAARQRDDEVKMEMEEGMNLTQTLFDECIKRHIAVKRLDTTHWNYAQDWSGTNAHSDPHGWLYEMMTAAANLATTRNGHRVALGASVLVKRAMDELNEFMEPKITNEARKEELIDALWFLLLACMACDMGPQQVFETFMKKAVINNYRESSGTKPHLHHLEEK